VTEKRGHGGGGSDQFKYIFSGVIKPNPKGKKKKKQFESSSRGKFLNSRSTSFAGGERSWG